MLRGLGRCWILLAWLPGAALAGDVSGDPLAGNTLTIGVEARWQPRWDGANSSTIVPLPVFDVRPSGTPARFRSARDGGDLTLFGDGRFRAGPTVKVRLARKEDDDAALRGLGNIDWAIEVGGFAEYWWVPWLRTRAELRQGFGGHRGIVGDLIADVVVPVTGKLTLSAGPRLTFANSAATSPYFSISAAQSAASGLPMFDARGGLRSFGAGTQARYFWTPRWATHAFVEYERLAGDAKNSPLVMLRGTPDQWTFGVGVTYDLDLPKR